MLIFLIASSLDRLKIQDFFVDNWHTTQSVDYFRLDVITAQGNCCAA